jgi:hypothetical protein
MDAILWAYQAGAIGSCIFLSTERCLADFGFHGELRSKLLDFIEIDYRLLTWNATILWSDLPNRLVRNLVIKTLVMLQLLSNWAVVA